MSAKMEIELQPWTVPNYVGVKMPIAKREEGFKEGPKYHVSELTNEALSALCDEFRTGVFEKAGKVDPRNT